MQVLARHGYFDGTHSVLDYGCGKGDDVRELEVHGVNVYGWDPTHRPEGKVATSDIVNLGYVFNVIEDTGERANTLKQAYQYVNKLLIVSVMVAGASTVRQFKLYKRPYR
jgi:DNA phosphorothioation-associated putative methyltransferase